MIIIKDNKTFYNAVQLLRNSGGAAWIIENRSSPAFDGGRFKRSHRRHWQDNKAFILIGRGKL